VKIPVEYKPETCISDDVSRRKALRTAEVEVEPDGSGRIVAVDGYTLVALPVNVLEDYPKPSGPVCAEALERARKLAKAQKLAEAEILLAADHYTFADGSTMPRTLRGEGETFPAWREISTPQKGEPGTFEVAFDLALLVQIAEALGDKKGKLVLTVKPDTEGKTAGETTGPIAVRRIGGQSGEIAMLMPVHLTTR
jgi:hypothetical protein